MNRSKVIILLGAIFLLSGCATYKFYHGKAPYNKGYVVSRDDYTILEYTLGKNDTVPSNIKVAKQRFQRRRNTVEDAYKRMGYVDNHFTMLMWKPAIYLLKMVGGVFSLPFVAVSDYRYGHNPKYRERVKKLEEEQDLKEANRIKSLKDKLNEYVQKDLDIEEVVFGKKSSLLVIPEQAKTEVIKEEVIVSEPKEIKPEDITQEQAKQEAIIKPKEEVVVTEKIEPVLEKPAVVQEKIIEPVVNKTEAAEEKSEAAAAKIEEPVVQEAEVVAEKPVAVEADTQASKEKTDAVAELVKEVTQAKSNKKEIKAVIIAKPVKGYSPLRVKFSGAQSRSPYGKIIDYAWALGDGDSAAKSSAINTFWSGSFGSKTYTVTLNVQDDKGNTGQSSVLIEVLNK